MLSGGTVKNYSERMGNRGGSEVAAIRGLHVSAAVSLAYYLWFVGCSKPPNPIVARAHSGTILGNLADTWATENPTFGTVIGSTYDRAITTCRDG